MSDTWIYYQFKMKVCQIPEGYDLGGIEADIGFAPTRIIKAKSKPHIEKHMAVLESEIFTKEIISEQFTEWLLSIEHLFPRLKQFVEKHNARLLFSIITQEKSGGVFGEGIEAQAIKILADLGAGISWVDN